ncbi:MAG: metallophosphoesterase [Deltaproteobacteria bacterium]|nr:metallophosphoesterase [Deltaproteobacteria bacterium]
MAGFIVYGAAATAAVITHAGLRRGRLFALFSGIFTGVHTLAASALLGALGSTVVTPVVASLNVLVYAHFVALGQPAWRPGWYRSLVSVPASFVSATTLLSLPFAGAIALGAPTAVLAVPLALGVYGLWDSLRSPREVLSVTLDQQDVGALKRVTEAVSRVENPSENSDKSASKTLRIVQITDPHLGVFMSVERLRAVVERAVAQAPDLVFLTGDFLTMESQADPGLLARALEPLLPLAGRTFACMGNHDHEAPRTVMEGLKRAGVTLLVDELSTVETAHGPLEILGYDFRFRDRAAHLAEVSAAFPRRPSVGRVAMLHDPGAFAHLPEGSADLVLAGHTHGGQVGFVRWGIVHTVVSVFTKIPDHGMWGQGRARLYVHRGTGHYGFPLRVGVPSEESVLVVSGLFGQA